MRSFSVILILFPLICGQNNTNTTIGSTRCAGALTRSPLDWIQQALGTASNAFTLGVETGRQWFNFGINTANQWVNAVHNPSNSTTNQNSSSTAEGQVEQAIRREIAKLQKELGNKGTWFRRVKERRLQFLIDKLNSLHDSDENNLDHTVTPMDVSNYNFTLTAPVTKPAQSSSQTTDDSIISVIT